MQHFSQIAPRVYTLVLFIILSIHGDKLCVWCVGSEGGGGGDNHVGHLVMLYGTYFLPPVTPMQNPSVHNYDHGTESETTPLLYPNREHRRNKHKGVIRVILVLLGIGRWYCKLLFCNYGNYFR